MTTKQMLLSVLMLGATSNIALAIEKPVIFTMNINSKDFPANLPIPSSEIKNTLIAFNTTPEENPYAYQLLCQLNDLKINREAINKELQKISSPISLDKKLISLDKEINCVYCPSGVLNFNTIILNTKNTNDCDRLAIGMLLTSYRELNAEHQKLATEFRKIQSK